jgi:competence protein ComEA
VAAPGYYPLLAGDTLTSPIQAAGGATADADFNHLKLHLPGTTQLDKPQKIDLNRAESWLLKCLPGIGDTLAERIIDYRQSNGSFRNTGELTLVEGIGPATYENLKGLVTVTDW